MPTYGYQCTRCENAFEVFQKITDDALSTCDQCGGELRKKIFPVGIQFKGTGFYVNDYAGGGKAKEPATASEPAAESVATAAGDGAQKPGDNAPAATPAAPVAAPAETTKPGPAAAAASESK